MSNKETAKNKSIVEYLQKEGFYYIKDRSKGRYFVYHSPLRTDSQPSFYVHKKRNLWVDYGMSKQWDDVISLVQQLRNVKFTEAINFLLKKNFKSINREKEIYVHKPGVEIVDLCSLKNEVLINYLKYRKINVDIAKLYCNEALVRFPGGSKPEKMHRYISFKNDKNGYELRNQYSVDIRKVSTSPKYFTKIKGEQGCFNVFEGFMNFLTLLTMYRTQRLKYTTIVLNSLVNITYVLNSLKINEVNNLFLDNDEPANTKIKLLDELEIPFTDQRFLYSPENDLNEYYCNRNIN